MKHIEKFMKKRIFNFKDAYSELDEKESLTKNTLQMYLKKGYIKRVKRNLYVAVSFENGGVIPNRYEIASHITKSSHISHHSAFEFYGASNQVYNTVYVSSHEQFKDFTFEGVTYKYVYCPIKNVPIDRIRGVKVSTISRTIVDSINTVKSYDDMEELIENMKSLPLILGEEILSYLELVNKKVLYNKVGLILSFFMNDITVTESHLKEIKKNYSKVAKSFTSEKNRLTHFYKEWNIHSYNIDKLMEG